MDEFSDVVGQSADPNYCQAWEACAQHHYESYQDVFSSGYRRYLHLEDMGEDNATNTTQFPYEGESRGFADDATWILTSSFVIFTMQSGFGLLESGSCSPGFEVNIMMKNIVDVVFTSLTWYLVGYGIAFGEPSNGFVGLGNFPASGGYEEVSSGRLYSKYIFQLSFAATSCTIVSGAAAMRLKFFIYCLYSLISVVFYAFVAHWTFAMGGFLYRMGAHDFAGGAAVHVFGGINGLIATMFLGPRTGRFDGTRPITDFMPSSPSSQCFGLLVLWWGWIGFNCGSTFGITDDLWVVAIRCAVTTINSTVGGGLASILYTLWRTKGQLVIPEHVINGILGALVAITPACACVHTYIAFLIGLVGALVGLGMNTLVCHCKIDDPIGVTGVHAASGMWGLIAVGLFADGGLPGIKGLVTGDKGQLVEVYYYGLFYGGGFELLGLQVLTIICTTAWAVMWSSGFFYLVGIALSRDWRNPRKGLRISLEEEKMGADAYQHGVSDHGVCRRRSDTIIGFGAGMRHPLAPGDYSVGDTVSALSASGKPQMCVKFDTLDDSDRSSVDSGRRKARGKTQMYGKFNMQDINSCPCDVPDRYNLTSADVVPRDDDDGDSDENKRDSRRGYARGKTQMYGRFNVQDENSRPCDGLDRHNLTSAEAVLRDNDDGDCDENNGDPERGKARGKTQMYVKFNIQDQNSCSCDGLDRHNSTSVDSESRDNDYDGSDHNEASGYGLGGSENDSIAWHDTALPAASDVPELEQHLAGPPGHDPRPSETSNSTDDRRATIRRQSHSSREMMYVGARGDARRTFRRNSEIGLLSGRAQENFSPRTQEGGADAVEEEDRRATIRRQSYSSREMMYAGARGDARRTFRRNSGIGLLSDRAQGNFSPRKQEGGADAVAEDGGGTGPEDSTRYLEFLRVLESEGRGSEASYHKFLDILEDIRSRSSRLSDRA